MSCEETNPGESLTTPVQLARKTTSYILDACDSVLLLAPDGQFKTWVCLREQHCSR